MNYSDLIYFKKMFRPLYDEVKSNDFCRNFAAKKYRHSIQVLTIGREIAARDKKLKIESEEFIALGEKALLFHDVGRFMEIFRMYKDNIFSNDNSCFSKSYDHGVFSYEMMKDICDYNDVRILASLKHHGHMMEKFFADSEFNHVEDIEINRQMLAILDWVRDADKLANFYIQRYENNLKKDLFFVTMSDEVKNGKLSPDVLAQFDNEQVILTGTIKSYADRQLCCLSWIFDLNYKASYQICAENGYFDMLLDLLGEYNHEPELQNHISTKIRIYLTEKII